MANNRTLTATNAVIAVAVANLFPTPQILDGFEADNNFTLGDLTVAETVLTLDGSLEGGYINSIVDWTINILPTSNSKKFFVDWMQASRTNQDMFRGTFNVTLPGEKANYTLSNGILVSGAIMPSVKSIQQSTSYKLQFSSRDIVMVAAL